MVVLLAEHQLHGLLAHGASLGLCSFVMVNRCHALFTALDLFFAPLPISIKLSSRAIKLLEIKRRLHLKVFDNSNSVNTSNSPW